MPRNADTPPTSEPPLLDDPVGPVFRAASEGVEPPRWIAAVRAVIPCFNRAADLQALLDDFDSLRTRADFGEIHLDVLVVDNASDPPLKPARLPSNIPVSIVRLPANTGGSGGYNAGMARLLGEPWGAAVEAREEYLWLIDSDVRLTPGTLIELLDAMRRRPDLVIAGSALADPLTGEVFEIGGMVDPAGGYGPALRKPDGRDVVPCHYVAAACALARRWAVERVGLLPDRFLNGDDVEWCIRLARETGGAVGAIPASLAMHPRFDRFVTHLRYYGARSSMGPITALGLPRRARFRRATVEVARALNQEMMGRDDLAALHLRGIHDALLGRTTGPAAPDVLRFEKFRPWTDLAEALRALNIPAPRVHIAPGTALPDPGARVVEQALRAVWRFETAVPRGLTGVRQRGLVRGAIGALWRGTLGPRPDVSIVPAEGRASSWFAGRWLVEATPEGFVLRRLHRIRTWRRALAGLISGTMLAVRHGLHRGELEALPPAHEPVHRGLVGVVHGEARARAAVTADPTPAPPAPNERALSLSVVVLSYNRREALRETLQRMAGDSHEVVVVDNHSTDGSVDMVRREFPRARLVVPTQNLGVEAFNRGVAAASGDVVLILDDDARVDPSTLSQAMQLLARRPGLAAVTFQPKHPKSGRSEWRHAAAAPAGGTDRWPLMGCANLVRRNDWMNVRGYDPAFFLYRNDVDLALKLLEAGRGVHFNPAWFAEHDSPAALKKSKRWFRLATRNWVWLARRHGHGRRRWTGALAGWAWAHRLAGVDLPRQGAALRGGIEGLLRSPPPLPPTVKSTGRSWKALLRLLLSSEHREAD